MNHAPCLKLAISVVLTSTCLVSGVQLAANAQTVPAQVNPGVLTPQPSTQEIQKQQQEVQKQLPGAENQIPKVEIEVPKQKPSVMVQIPTFHANKITVEGATLLTSQQLDPITHPYVNKDISLDDLEKVVDKINGLYREKGYLTSEAYVPPQDIKDGSVVIKVIEGKIGKVSIIGNKYNRPFAITRDIREKPGQLFNLKALENDLNLTNQINTFKVKAKLSPGERAGETDVKINVAERQPWQLTPTFDNMGRPYIGTYRGGAELTNDSLFGFGDRLVTKYLGAAGTQIGLASYFVPVGHHGDELGVNYGYSHVNVDLHHPQPGIHGSAQNFGLLYTHPFDRNRTWIGDVGINARHVTSTIDGTRASLNNIRSFQAGLTFNKFDRYGRTFARLQSSVGVGALGGNTEYWKGQAYLTRLITLPKRNVLMIRGYSQFTGNALPPVEEMQIGGAYSVRGYTTGLLLGDRGYNVTVEDRFPIPYLRKVSPWLDDRLQGAVFYDIGQIWLSKSNSRYVAGISSNAQHTLLMGTGFGLRFRLTQYMLGFMDVGFGLLNRNAIEPFAQPTARVYFGLRSDLLSQNVIQRDTQPTYLPINTKTH